MQSCSSYYLGFLIDYRNIAMTLIREKQNKEKIQSVNCCIKPVHFCIYTKRGIVYVHATYCHTLCKWVVLQAWNHFTLSGTGNP